MPHPVRAQDHGTYDIQVGMTIDRIRFYVVSLSPLIPGLKENNPVVWRVVGNAIDGFLQISTK